jgi:8-oxo-dGTP diphosphatase
MAGDAPLTVAVACGVLVNAAGEVLIAQRPTGKIAAGLWEFPGGKIEAGETAAAALTRELHEELGITVRGARPLIRVQHAYAERTVRLDTWRVDTWDGKPQGREDQALAWSLPVDLHAWPLLAADAPIVNALQLPDHYVFTPPQMDAEALLAALPTLPAGALLRLRLPTLDDPAYAALAARVIPAADPLGLRVVLDRDPAQATALGAWGWHASASRVAALQAADLDRLPARRIASAHTAEELAAAQRVGFSAAVLGTLKPSASHPGQPGIGWHGFAECTQGLALPVYAIGGLARADLGAAFAHYAQGLAGITGYWKNRESR